MQYDLYDYQDTAKLVVGRALASMDRAYQEDSNDLGAVVLAAPTGAGKTVIATAVIEAALDGDATTAAIDDATFLWVTDDLSLNNQTLNKMLFLIRPADPADGRENTMETFDLLLAGGLGGLAVGLGRLAYLLIDIESDRPHYRQTVGAQIVVTVILIVLGGTFAYYFDGKVGAFMSGITALSLLLLIGGNVLKRRKDEGAGSGSTANQ
ncbi:hypothetical protein FQ377_14155 [Arthrobacter echini]|uniref:Helicase/UvrB N-terminal domain-containing protein n=1 Tax=Arthrobacter echini TaxID=1529066 RepID=A0A5D0XJQ3_9MICC|nr:DEAD/DEAH box helicase family protein [Arthrobacter echini]TYC96326.1 hypothetical protein FQ377_14155 [Arthrobacter echini]